MSFAGGLVRTSSGDMARGLVPAGVPQSLGPSGHNNDAYEEPEACSAPEPQPPVPFILLLLLVSAGVLAVLPLLGACSVQMHRLLLGVGVALALPLLVLEAMLLCGGRAWLLERFLAGDYSEGATARKLQCLWYPEKVQILEYTTGEAAGRRIEQYAAWETTAIVEYAENVRGGNRDGGSVVRDAALRVGREARINGLQKAPELNGSRCTCQQWLDEQGRWRVRLQDGSAKDVKPENLRALHNFRIEVPGSFGAGVEVSVLRDGELRGAGLPFQAEFDGSSLVATSGPREGQAWRKAGYWRLDFVTKVLMAMAVIGLEAVFAAAVLPPGVVSEASARLPLKAVFLVDGSSSITQSQWVAAMRANKQFIANFEDVYSSDQGKLNFGLVQFSSDAQVELPISHELSTVIETLDGMVLLGGDTDFYNALSRCQQQLKAYTSVGKRTFDVCVLITDGEDRSFQSESELKSLVAKDTAVFGIFVGSDDAGSRELHRIIQCGKAGGHGDEGCDFFARATDFDGLALRTREIAEVVARGSDIALCAERSALIEGPFLLALVVPYILWYLSCCTFTIAKRRLNSYNQAASEDLLKLRDRA
mmetsp:Transcript_16267/g.38181  ORF Transcript_16267/g.38181 Transcript_16267/m.38181 type:complete len:592 (+) Transcript_16267:62-1837(+)